MNNPQSSGHTRLLLLFAILAGILVTACLSDSARQDMPHKTVLLVRHAEQQNQSKDPPLSKAGGDRAVRLSQMLKGQPVHAVFTTEYLRAKMTAKVVAIPHKLEILEYGTSNLGQLIPRLDSIPYGQIAVVVGHSNTTPVLVKLLDEKTDYPQIPHDNFDQIYLVHLYEDGGVMTELTSYDDYEKSLGQGEG